MCLKYKPAQDSWQHGDPVASSPDINVYQFAT